MADATLPEPFTQQYLGVQNGLACRITGRLFTYQMTPNQDENPVSGFIPPGFERFSAAVVQPLSPPIPRHLIVNTDSLDNWSGQMPFHSAGFLRPYLHPHITFFIVFYS